ncbi:hypothetical protein F5888DRAFT_1693628 [Russula emetica]|nr:hypothetical protein F5888DRAFT_1693628 [Russula emetica]
MFGLSDTSRIDCQAYATFGTSLSNIAFGAASLLIVLRIIAIWNREKIIILIAMGVWVTDVAFLIYEIRNSWSHELNACVLVKPDGIKPGIMGSLIADVVLLLIMLIGLLRLRFGAGDGFNLERVLWKQGLIWLLLAIVCEIPPTVHLSILGEKVTDSLRLPVTQIFQIPNVITMTIAATRMYRSLMDVGSTESLQDGLPDTGSGVRTVSKIRVRSGPFPLSQMESVRTKIDQSSKSQMAGSSLFTSTDSHGR